MLQDARAGGGKEGGTGKRGNADDDADDGEVNDISRDRVCPRRGGEESREKLAWPVDIVRVECASVGWKEVSWDTKGKRGDLRGGGWEWGLGQGWRREILERAREFYGCAKISCWSRVSRWSQRVSVEPCATTKNTHAGLRKAGEEGRQPAGEAARKHLGACWWGLWRGCLRWMVVGRIFGMCGGMRRGGEGGGRWPCVGEGGWARVLCVGGGGWGRVSVRGAVFVWFLCFVWCRMGVLSVRRCLQWE